MWLWPNKSLAYFERLFGEMKVNTWNETVDNHRKSLLSAFCLIALQYQKQNETFAIGEELIKPGFIAASKEIVDSKATQKRKDLPPSSNTVQRRIVDMAKYVEDQVVEGIKKSVYMFFLRKR